MKYKLNLKKFLRFIVLMVALIVLIVFIYDKFIVGPDGNNSSDSKVQKSIENKESDDSKNGRTKESNEVKIIASGDMLYHDIVYWSAK